MYYLSPNAVTSNNHSFTKINLSATRTYIKPDHRSYLQDVQRLNNGPEAILPNGYSIRASKQANIKLSQDVTLPSLIYSKLASK